MPYPFEGLKPESLWKYFYELTRIPRGSKRELKAADYVVKVAKEHGLEMKQDKFANVLVKTPATAGFENAKTVVLQGHLDMVCEKNKDVKHDFEKDPINAVVDGGWVKATGTTLGSDNGVGVAAALAVMTDTTLQHGPMEFLFTIDEETGLTGASNLQKGFLSADTLLNLDSEEDGALYIGCSGGKDNVITLSTRKRKAPKGAKTFEVRVGGLKGGHSGLNIHEGRANAIVLLTRALRKLSAVCGVRIVSMNSGSKRNAIPREAEAVVLVKADEANLLKKTVPELEKMFKSEFATLEKGLFLKAEASKKKATHSIGAEDQQTLLNLLHALPHGVIGMSADIPGLVETSTNLATVSTDNGKIVIGTSQRSSVQSELDDLAEKVRSIAHLACAEVETEDGYPGWKPNVDSPVLKFAKQTYGDLFGKEPEVKAIHAGLECGIIGEKFPGLDMISFGPTIEGAHSPDERVNIETVGKFWNFLVEMLGRLAKA